MLFSFGDGLILTVVLFAFCTRFNGVEGNEERFRIEGRALVYGVRAEEWTPRAHVLLHGEEHVGFVRSGQILQLQCRALVSVSGVLIIDLSHFSIDLMEVSLSMMCRPDLTCSTLRLRCTDSSLSELISLLQGKCGMLLARCDTDSLLIILFLSLTARFGTI